MRVRRLPVPGNLGGEYQGAVQVSRVLCLRSSSCSRRRRCYAEPGHFSDMQTESLHQVRRQLR